MKASFMVLCLSTEMLLPVLVSGGMQGCFLMLPPPTTPIIMKVRLHSDMSAAAVSTGCLNDCHSEKTQLWFDFVQPCFSPHQ